MENQDSRNVPQTALATVPFHGDMIVTFEHDGTRFVSMRRIVENIGLEWARQAAKLQDAGEKFNCVHMPTVGADGKSRDMLCMPLEKLPLWLASINPNKIKDERIRAKVERYQAESAIALHDYWTKGVAVRGDLDGVVTDMDAGARKVLGGIVKNVITAALRDTVPAMVKAEILNQQYEVVNGVTAGGALDMAGIKARKGLRGLARYASCRLLRYHAERRVAVKMGTLGSRTAYVFEPNIVKDWLKSGGKAELDQHVAQRRGQGVLKLVPATTKDGEGGSNV
jgi:hypothetical protein